MQSSTKRVKRGKCAECKSPSWVVMDGKKPLNMAKYNDVLALINLYEEEIKELKRERALLSHQSDGFIQRIRNMVDAATRRN